MIRVGSGYQAVVPAVSTVCCKPAPSDAPEHAVLVWSPYNDVNEKELENYIANAKDKYNYNMEQALGMLCWHKFDLKTALTDLPNFTPFPDDWSVEDKVLFEQAFQFHDKHFTKIRQMLPDKSIASLVKYYYSWKKTRSRTSLMDRQARKLKEDAKDDGSDNVSDIGSEVGDEASKHPEIHDPRVDGKPRCENCCTTATGQFHQTPKGMLCNACFSHWRRTGSMKPNAGPSKAGKPTEGPSIMEKQTRKPPRGMFVNREDLTLLATGPPGTGDATLKLLDQEIVSLKRQAQNNKQIISQVKHKISLETKGDMTIPTVSLFRILSCHCY